MIAKRLRLSVLAAAVVLSSQYSPAKQNLGTPLGAEYYKWLDEDVHWIISVPEQKEFLRLSTDEQRDRFVVGFWERRNPNPGSKENVFKEEHYRRLAYANEHFAAGVPGWKTDRGHVYILYGPPDSVVKHSPASGTPPEELWNYRYMPGARGEVTLKFVDHCACGEFKLLGNLPSD